MKKATQVDVQWRGVFITCNRGREAQCAREARPLFEEVIEEMIGQSEKEVPDLQNVDIEDEIAKEVANMTDKKQKHVVIHDSLGIECVLFAQVRPKIDCTQLVLNLCKAVQSKKRSVKYIMKLSPVDKFCKLDFPLDLKSVVEVKEGEKFAIHPTLRLTTTNRDEVIKEVAKLVGPDRRVSLTDFDCILMVTGFKTIIGCATVPLNAADFKKLCKLNLVQLNAQ